MKARKNRDEKESAALEIMMLATVTVLVTVMVAPLFSRSVNSAKKAADDGNIRAAYTERSRCRGKSPGTEKSVPGLLGVMRADSIYMSNTPMMTMPTTTRAMQA